MHDFLLQKIQDFSLPEKTSQKVGFHQRFLKLNHLQVRCNLVVVNVVVVVAGIYQIASW